MKSYWHFTFIAALFTAANMEWASCYQEGALPRKWLIENCKKSIAMVDTLVYGTLL